MLAINNFIEYFPRADAKFGLSFIREVEVDVINDCNQMAAPDTALNPTRCNGKMLKSDYDMHRLDIRMRKRITANIALMISAVAQYL